MHVSLSLFFVTCWLSFHSKGMEILEGSIRGDERSQLFLSCLLSLIYNRMKILKEFMRVDEILYHLINSDIFIAIFAELTIEK